MKKSGKIAVSTNHKVVNILAIKKMQYNVYMSQLMCLLCVAIIHEKSIATRIAISIQ